MWPLVLLGAVAVMAWANRGGKKIFITYDYDNDSRYKNMLVAWAKNSAFDLSFVDHSTDISVQSKEIGVVRRVVSSRIREASCVLCIVGKQTWRSSWVEWEVDKAIELGKPLIAVKTAKSNRAPENLNGAGASWALAFRFDAIKRAIDKV